MAPETAETDLLIAGLVHRVPWTREQLANIFGTHFLEFTVPRTDRPDVTIVNALESSQIRLTAEEALVETGEVLAWSSRFGAIRLARATARCELLTAQPRHARWILRFVTGALLSRHDGLLVHGAGLVHEGRGYLYLGPSGAGKSTFARLVASRGGTVLCDESIAIRFRGDRPILHATPYTFAEKWIGTPGDAPLMAVFLLDHSRAPGRTPIAPTKAASILAQSLFFKLTSQSLRTNFLDTATRLTETCPWECLSFSLEKIPWPPSLSLTA